MTICSEGIVCLGTLLSQWISYDANKDGKISWGEFKKTTFVSESSIGSLIGCPVFPGSLLYAQLMLSTV